MTHLLTSSLGHEADENNTLPIQSSLCLRESIAFCTDSEEESIKETASEFEESVGTSKHRKRRQVSMAGTFPEKLMALLSSHETTSQGAISWLPSGDGFIIASPKKFILEVLPKYFKQTEFSSFTRKLYWWGFKKTSKGQDCDSFRHELFRRDDPSLCSKMMGGKRATTSSKNKKTKNASKHIDHSNTGAVSATSSREKSHGPRGEGIHRHLTSASPPLTLNSGGSLIPLRSVTGPAQSTHLRYNANIFPSRHTSPHMMSAAPMPSVLHTVHTQCLQEQRLVSPLLAQMAQAGFLNDLSPSDMLEASAARSQKAYPLPVSHCLQQALILSCMSLNGHNRAM